MRVLVTAASRHDATAGIAREIATTLGGYGIEAEALAPGAIAAVDGFDAVVLGSAVYMGRWLPEARDFADRFAGDLATRPVWLFSSGPVGDPPKPTENAVDVAPLVDRLAARGHASFSGALHADRLGLRERLIMRAFGAPQGDYRPWEAIRSWAATIAHDLLRVPAR